LKEIKILRKKDELNAEKIKEISEELEEYKAKENNSGYLFDHNDTL